jgi:outer membrane lipoprotein-sorting protein
MISWRKYAGMNRFYPDLILALGCCWLLTSPLTADDIISPFALNKQFSADQVITAGGTTMTSKVFSDNGKMRTEMNTGGMQMVSIVRPDLQKIYSVMVAQKMIMEMPYDASKVGQQMTSSGQDGKFELVGPDTVDGVACNKYKLTSKDNKISFMWIDAAKKIPLKMAAGDNSYTLVWKNYKVGPQDASLFEPPADYQTMKMPGAGAAPAPAVPGGAPGASGQ